MSPVTGASSDAALSSMRSVPASTSMRCAVRTVGPGTASVPAPFFVSVEAAMDVTPVNTVSPAVSNSKG